MISEKLIDEYIDPDRDVVVCGAPIARINSEWCYIASSQEEVDNYHANYVKVGFLTTRDLNSINAAEQITEVLLREHIIVRNQAIPEALAPDNPTECYEFLIGYKIPLDLVADAMSRMGFPISKKRIVKNVIPFSIYWSYVRGSELYPDSSDATVVTNYRMAAISQGIVRVVRDARHDFYWCNVPADGGSATSDIVMDYDVAHRDDLWFNITGPGLTGESFSIMEELAEVGAIPPYFRIINEVTSNERTIRAFNQFLERHYKEVMTGSNQAPDGWQSVVESNLPLLWNDNFLSRVNAYRPQVLEFDVNSAIYQQTSGAFLDALEPFSKSLPPMEVEGDAQPNYSDMISNPEIFYTRDGSSTVLGYGVPSLAMFVMSNEFQDLLESCSEGDEDSGTNLPGNNDHIDNQNEKQGSYAQQPQNSAVAMFGASLATSLLTNLVFKMIDRSKD